MKKTKKKLKLFLLFGLTTITMGSIGSFATSCFSNLASSLPNQGKTPVIINLKQVSNLLSSIETSTTIDAIKSASALILNINISDLEFNFTKKDSLTSKYDIKIKPSDKYFFDFTNDAKDFNSNGTIFLKNVSTLIFSEEEGFKNVIEKNMSSYLDFGQESIDVIYNWENDYLLSQLDKIISLPQDFKIISKNKNGNIIEIVGSSELFSTLYKLVIAQTSAELSTSPIIDMQIMNNQFENIFNFQQILSPKNIINNGISNFIKDQSNNTYYPVSKKDLLNSEGYTNTIEKIINSPLFADGIISDIISFVRGAISKNMADWNVLPNNKNIYIGHNLKISKKNNLNVINGSLWFQINNLTGNNMILNTSELFDKPYIIPSNGYFSSVLTFKDSSINFDISNFINEKNTAVLYYNFSNIDKKIYHSNSSQIENLEFIDYSFETSPGSINTYFKNVSLDKNIFDIQELIKTNFRNLPTTDISNDILEYINYDFQVIKEISDPIYNVVKLIAANPTINEFLVNIGPDVSKIIYIFTQNQDLATLFGDLFSNISLKKFLNNNWSTIVNLLQQLGIVVSKPNSDTLSVNTNGINSKLSIPPELIEQLKNLLEKINFDDNIFNIISNNFILIKNLIRYAIENFMPENLPIVDEVFRLINQIFLNLGVSTIDSVRVLSLLTNPQSMTLILNLIMKTNPALQPTLNKIVKVINLKDISWELAHWQNLLNALITPSVNDKPTKLPIVINYSIRQIANIESVYYDNNTFNLKAKANTDYVFLDNIKIDLKPLKVIFKKVAITDFLAALEVDVGDLGSLINLAGTLGDIIAPSIQLYKDEYIKKTFEINDIISPSINYNKLNWCAEVNSDVILYMPKSADYFLKQTLSQLSWLAQIVAKPLLTNIIKYYTNYRYQTNSIMFSKNSSSSFKNIPVIDKNIAFNDIYVEIINLSDVQVSNIASSIKYVDNMVNDKHQLQVKDWNEFYVQISAAYTTSPSIVGLEPILQPKFIINTTPGFSEKPTENTPSTSVKIFFPFPIMIKDKNGNYTFGDQINLVF